MQWPQGCWNMQPRELEQLPFQRGDRVHWTKTDDDIAEGHIGQAEEAERLNGLGGLGGWGVGGWLGGSNSAFAELPKGNQQKRGELPLQFHVQGLQYHCHFNTMAIEVNGNFSTLLEKPARSLSHLVAQNG